MEEILLVAVVEAIQELSHNGGIVLLRELHHPRLQKAHQVVIHVLEDQVEGSLVLRGKNEGHVKILVMWCRHDISLLC